MPLRIRWLVRSATLIGPNVLASQRSGHLNTGTGIPTISIYIILSQENIRQRDSVPNRILILPGGSAADGCMQRAWGIGGGSVSERKDRRDNGRVAYLLGIGAVGGLRRLSV